MSTLTAIREGRIEMSFPIQLMFGGCPVDPELVEVFAPQPRWDAADMDEMLEARCNAL